MDVREKLVELLKTLPTRNGYTDLEDIADHIIANGVTVQEDCKECAEATQNCIVKLQEQIAELRSAQEWVSVNDRLPDLIPRSAGIAYSETVIVLTSGRNETIAVWDGITWIAQFDFCELWGEKITHWMPLPHPPKGE